MMSPYSYHKYAIGIPYSYNNDWSSWSSVNTTFDWKFSPPASPTTPTPVEVKDEPSNFAWLRGRVSEITDLAWV